MISSERIFVMGDIHGAYKALVQCLERSKFNAEIDKLIFLGDVVDGWPESKECVSELMCLDNLVSILGNHDQWFLDHCNTGWQETIWLSQGGRATLESYKFIPHSHHKFFRDMLPHYVMDNKLFVHGGYSLRRGIEKTDLETKLWDRTLYDMAQAFQRTESDFLANEYDEIYIGHTATHNSKFPIKGGNIWLMDQGAGWRGYLTIMDIDTKEYWQSDFVPGLYPEYKGRK